MELSSDDLSQIARPHHLHDEICIVCTGDFDDNQAANQPVYQGVLDWLNPRLARLLPPPLDPQAAAPASVDAGNAFTRDLAPLRYGVWRRWRGAGAMLAPPNRQGIDHWVLLHRAGGRAKLLCFYTINLDPTDRDLPPPVRATTIRTLVNLINRHLRQEPIANLDPLLVRIDAATPHWLANVAETTCPGVGGPASAPQPGPAPGAPNGQSQSGSRQGSSEQPVGGSTWSFRFDDQPLDNTVSKHRSTATEGPADQDRRVVVAIIDTCPSEDVITKVKEKGYYNNWLLGQVIDSVQRHDCLPQPSGSPASHLHRYLPNWAGEHTRVSDASEIGHYAIPDHGLFVAGIVRDIAPDAEIHLYRAVNDYGVTDIHTISHILRTLADEYRPTRGNKRPLVVNLSLMFGVPTRKQLIPHWFPHSFRALPAMQPWLGDILETLDDLHSGAFELFDWLNERGVLVVAAAGNDGQGVDSLRPEPRIPARYDTELENVIGAASINKGGRPSQFSNRGNVLWGGTGLATFGGDASPSTNAAPHITTDVDGRPDAVIGIACSPDLPLGAVPNKTGWAYWAGTSFATAILSGIAATAWAAAPDEPPAKVVARIRGYATRLEHPLECPAIDAWQEAVSVPAPSDQGDQAQGDVPAD